MTFFGGGDFNNGGSRSSMLSQSASRSQILGRRYQPFANPFFDQASTYTPPTVKSLFGFCRFYHLTHGIINAVGTKAAEYPVTDLILQHKETAVVRKWEELLLGVMNYRVHQFEINLDYYVYGNAFVSPSFPFRKILTCGNSFCHAELDALAHRPDWRYVNNRFWLTCPKCGQTDFAKSGDNYYPKYSDISLIRWNPENVQIFYNESTGRMDYLLDISADFRSQITMGRKDLVATTPEIFLDAIRMKRSLVFDKQEVFHLRRPSLSSTNRGWGVPLIMPVLKDAFYVQIMKKAQECVHPDTLIDTRGGLQPARDVEVGSLVRTHTGAFQPVVVKRTKPMDEERDFSVTLQISGLREMASTFSNNHPIQVLRWNDIARRKDSKEHRGSSYVMRNPKLYGLEWVDAEHVEEGNYIGFPLARNKECFEIDVSKYGDFSAVSEEWVYPEVSQATADDYESGTDRTRYVRRLRAGEKAPRRMRRHLELNDSLAYIAGWYIGDGCADDRRVIFCMGPDDDGLLLKEAIAELFPFTTFTSRPSLDSRGWNLEVYGSSFARFIGAWLPGLAHTKAVPHEIQNAPDEIVAAFLRGYLESDGCSDSRRAQITTCNRDLAYTTWRLALSLRCIGTIAEVEAQDCVITNSLGEQQELKGNGRLAYYVTWTTRSKDRLLGLLYGGEIPEVTTGKSGFFFGDHFCGRVSSAEHGWCEEVISFEIAEDHTFCTPGMATHNSVLLTHLVPQTFLFPQPATAGADPFVSTSLANWRDHIRRELSRQRMDPAYYGILPFPLGHQTIGENGKSLLLMPEIRAMTEMICIGMGFPADLIFGQGSYAGSSVSMRMLENFFLSNVHSQLRLLHWVIRRMSAFLNWPRCDGRFKPFRMADDLQRQALMMQMNQAGKISDTTLLSYADLKVDDETALQVAESKYRAEAVRQQSLLQAEVQAEAQGVMAKAQARAQVAMQQAQAAAMTPPKDPFAAAQGSSLSGPAGVPLDAAAAGLAQAVKEMPPERQEAYLNQLRVEVPEMAQLMMQQGGLPQPEGRVGNAGGAAGAPEPPAVDMRPQPGVLPPRRSP